MLKMILAAIKIQKVWKGYALRKEWKNNKLKLLMQKAATKLLIRWRRFKVRIWLLHLANTYKNIKGEKVWGKYLNWPPPPKIGVPTLQPFSESLQRVYKIWRAKKMVKSLTPDEQEEMKQKVLALEIFRGVKPWNCSQRYKGDYLQLPTNLTHEKYIQGMQRLFATFGDTEILFADVTNKINRKGKSQRRAIIVTEKNIYKQDPNNYKVRKGELPLSQINGISLSKQKDTFIILHANSPYRDLVLDLGLNDTEKYSELVVVVVNQIRRLTDKTIPTKFSDS